MDQAMVAPNTFILKLNIHCHGCGRKLKKLLRRIKGVISVDLDTEQGTATIIATVDPQVVTTALAKVGQQAEILWEKENQFAIAMKNKKDLQIITQQPNATQNEQVMITQLEQLSNIENLKHVELTYSTTVKLSFKDEPVVENHTQSEKIVGDNLCKPQKQDAHEVNKVHGCGCNYQYDHNGYWAPAPPTYGWPPETYGQQLPPSWPMDIPSAPPLPEGYGTSNRCTLM